ncbi:unnamed protein product [Lasius platythorax]|uniref:Small ribosomal subunit protein bS16m n=1 Tax=Lasius platythorax TaxID=488582 RepID=A0AAV2P4J9_9HYME
MPRMPLHPASGTGIITPFSKAIRLVRYGCTNRPFYHIVIIDGKRQQKAPPIEQVSKPVADLLGLAGFLPVHPRTYMRAWRNRKIIKESAAKESIF